METFTPPFVVAIDIGTTHCRAQIYDCTLQPLPGLYVSRPQPVVRHDERAELDPEAGLAVLTDTLAELFARLNPDLPPTRFPIAAVGVASLWHSLVGVDADGYAVTPCLLWEDRRSTVQAERLRRQLDPEEYHRVTGAFLHPSFPACQILWWQEEDRYRAKKVARWLSLPEYYYLRLFGRTATSFSLASGSGLLDQRTLSWWPELLRLLGLAPEQLPPLGEADWVIGGLLSPFRQQLPRLADTPFLLPVGDGACDNLGAHALTEHNWSLMLGTSGALRVILPATVAQQAPFGLFHYRLLRDWAVVGGTVNSAGSLVEWLRRTLLLPGDPDLLEEELAALPGPSQLVILPDWAGRRSPDWPAAAWGVITGLSLSTRPLEIFRAALEAIGYRLRIIYKFMSGFAGKPLTVTATGGALQRWPQWGQILADILGTEITLSSVSETSLRGVARLALWATGNLHDLFATGEAAPPPGKLLAPNWEQHRKHDEAARRHQRLTSILSELQAPGVTY